MLSIGARILVDRQEALDEDVVVGVGASDAGPGKFVVRAEPAVAAKRHIEVPWDKINPAIGGIDVEIIVVAGGEKAVEIGERGVNGHKAQKLIHGQN